MPPPRPVPQSAPAASFDHLVGGEQKARRNNQAELLSCLQIYHKIVFRWLLVRQIRGLLPAQNAVDVRGGATENLNAVGAVVDQPTSSCSTTFAVNRRKPIPG